MQPGHAPLVFAAAAGIAAAAPHLAIEQTHGVGLLQEGVGRGGARPWLEKAPRAACVPPAVSANRLQLTGGSLLNHSENSEILCLSTSKRGAAEASAIFEIASYSVLRRLASTRERRVTSETLLW